LTRRKVGIGLHYQQTWTKNHDHLSFLISMLQKKEMVMSIKITNTTKSKTIMKKKKL